ncbi:flavo protein NADH-dependent oxidoreductase [Gymnopus androsaceus JB14]|uniref:Flavo protein NADH-dependent oxidoreductase n=1 Tax=Gymnopus androsaceus JB14 TaxID=1447944 RepID=A0A6A4H3H3_9AGAR|nr:flavo protein NADH-dependent oxidoreductase [Gymnopus androsaceus JB14]
MSKSDAAAPLFVPLQLGPLTLRNRVFMGALTRNRSVPTNIPNDVNVEYYRQRAQSAGLIVSEAVLVSQQGTEYPHAPGLWNKEQIAGWKKVTDAVHKEGGHIFAQLWHTGRVSHPDAPEQKASGQPVYAPSAISARGGKFRFLPGEPGYVTPTEIDDPTKLIDLYEQAAKNAKESGFDGLELHAASGYLLHQFLDSTSNKRTDSWGGSVANRSRFGLQVLERLISVFGKDRIGIKISPCGGYNDMGMPLDETIETFSYFISEIDELGIAYVNLTRYLPDFDPEFFKKRSTKHDVLETYSHLLKNVKLFADGGYTAEEAIATVKDGKIEGVFFGRAWIAHPDVAKRFEYGKALDNQLDFTRLLYGKYYGTEEEQKKGYIDYPPAKY